MKRHLGMVAIVAAMGCPGAQKPPDNVCGNSLTEAPEACDGNAFTCKEVGLSGDGMVTCKDDCSFDYTACVTCGNGEVEGNDECDGNTAPCSDLGLGEGTLTCDATCKFDTSGCGSQSGSANIQVRKNGEPLAAAPVAIADADGDVVASLVTDANGEVTHAIGANHIVTAGFTRQSGNKELRTFADVDPGDTVVFDFSDPAGTPQNLGSLSVTFGAQADVVTNRSANGCTSGQSSASSSIPHNLTVYSSCADAEGEGKLVAFGMGGAGELLAWQTFPDIAVSTSSPTPIVVNAWQTATTDLSCAMTNIPANTGDLRFSFSGSILGIDYSPPAILAIAPAAGTTETRTRSMPQTNQLTQAACTFAFDTAEDHERFATRVEAAPGTITVDGSKVLTPITNVAIDGSDPLRPALTWQEGPQVGSPDRTSASFYFMASGVFMTSIWVGPGTQTSPIKLPALPNDATFGPYHLSNFTRVVSSTHVQKADLGAITSYKELLGGPNLLTIPRTDYTVRAFVE